MQPAKCAGATATTSGPNMGEGQVSRKGKHRIPSSAFFIAGNDIHCCGRAVASVGIVTRGEGYVN
jgi:hypothetical protein